MATTKENVCIKIEFSSEIPGRETERSFSVKIFIGNGIKKEELQALLRHTRGIDKIFKEYSKRI